VPDCLGCGLESAEPPEKLNDDAIPGRTVAGPGRIRRFECKLGHRRRHADARAAEGPAPVRELSLYYAEYITEDGLAHLRHWKKLEILNLRGTLVTSKVFEHLAQMTGLRELDLGFTQIDDEGFEHLASLPELEKLGIGGNRLTGSSLPLLKLIPTLVDLDAGGIQRVGLWGLPLSEQNLQRLGQLRQLRRPNLNGATLNDRGRTGRDIPMPSANNCGTCGD